VNAGQRFVAGTRPAATMSEGDDGSFAADVVRWDGAADDA
jgi:hypothetical protein